MIDECDTLANLRETILLHRVNYSVTGDVASLTKALGCLERYFFLLAFSAYVNEWQSPLTTPTPTPTALPFDVIESPATASEGGSFSEWLSSRTEIWRMLGTLRMQGPRLFLFRPVEDLAVFARESEAEAPLAVRGPDLPVPSELETFVIKVYVCRRPNTR